MILNQSYQIDLMGIHTNNKPLSGHFACYVFINVMSTHFKLFTCHLTMFSPVCHFTPFWLGLGGGLGVFFSVTTVSQIAF